MSETELANLPESTDHTVLFKELTDATVMTLQCENVTVTVTYPVESEWLAQGVIDQLPEILAAAIAQARENLEGCTGEGRGTGQPHVCGSCTPEQEGSPSDG